MTEKEEVGVERCTSVGGFGCGYRILAVSIVNIGSGDQQRPLLSSIRGRYNGFYPGAKVYYPTGIRRNHP